MEWNNTLQSIIDYVEQHLQRKETPIEAEEISRLAGCSFNFFQKVFSYMNGISLAEYIRYRKLTLAGYDLKSTNMKVIDISYKYGYDSPTSFTKAFQHFHGCSPKEARDQAVVLNVYPKMQLHSKERYVWRIEKKAAFRLLGKSIFLSSQHAEHYDTIPAFWSECKKNGVFTTLVSLDTNHPKGTFGFFKYHDQALHALEYTIMVHSNRALPEGFQEVYIPEMTWAIFDCRGSVPSAIQKGWKYLEEEWLIKYPFKHATCPELEWYSDGNEYSNDYLSQIWIPIMEE